MNKKWNDIHCCQHRAKSNPDASERNMSCGPTSAFMALRVRCKNDRLKPIIGMKTHEAIRVIRREATGLGDEGVWTSLENFTDLLNRAGWDVEPHTGNESVPLHAIGQGTDGPILLLRGEGKQDHTWYDRFPHWTRAGYHFVVIAQRLVGSWVDGSDAYVLLDPLSPDGPVLVSEAEVRYFATVDDCMFDCYLLS